MDASIDGLAVDLDGEDAKGKGFVNGLVEAEGERVILYPANHVAGGLCVFGQPQTSD